MKVLKKVDVSNWSHTHKCRHCDSELELDNKDIQYTYVTGDQRDPGYEKFFAFCSICSNEFNIDSKIIPKILQLEVKNRQRSFSIYDR